MASPSCSFVLLYSRNHSYLSTKSQEEKCIHANYFQFVLSLLCSIFAIFLIDGLL